MSLTFYHSPMSTADITDLVLKELGVQYERIRVDIRKGETRSPEFLRLNPNGKVPLLVHDGSAIWESAAITLYLGDIFGVAKGLYPAPGTDRGEAMKWIVWSNVTLGEAGSRLMRNSADRFPAQQRNASAAEIAKADVHTCLRILDQSLAGKHFLIAGYTLADTHVHCITNWLRYMNVDFSAYANVSAWSKRCAARPAYERHVVES